MPKNILIIDDEELVVKSLSRLLKNAGYNVSTAVTAAEALDKVKRADHDLIICDIRMPGTDGVETIKHIRACLKDSKRKSIPEILITGYADMEKYNEAMELNVADYLYKPFDNEDLLRIVKKTIK